MKFLSDNCIQEIIAPQGRITAFDYSSELNLIASFEHCNGICELWNPETEEMVKEIDLESECLVDVIFLQYRYVAVTIEEGNHGNGICIHSVDSGDEIMQVDTHSGGYSGNGDFNYMVVSPDNRLLVGGLLSDFLLDFDNKKVVEERNIGDVSLSSDMSYLVQSLCCSKQTYNTICFTRIEEEDWLLEDGFCILVVDFSTDGKVLNTNVKEVTYCLIEGEKREIGKVSGLAHGGEYVIVATESEIILLESACEGSIGHEIVSSGIPMVDFMPHGQMVVNHKNQLMVSHGGNFIRVYEYNRNDSLQSLCRLRINNLLEGDKDKVDQLPLSQIVKNYLLYKA